MSRTTVLCYGDSNTYGFDPVNYTRYDENVRWPGILSQLSGDKYRIIEEGCNSRTICQDDPEEEWVNGTKYLKSCLYSHRIIDYLVIMLGTNDLKNRFNLTAEEIADDIEAMVAEAAAFLEKEQGKVPVILLVAPPVVADEVNESAFNDEFDETSILRSGKFGELYKRVADKQGCLFLDASTVVKSCKEDSIHLKPDMHRKLGEAVYRIIENS